ncbi:DNA glycosylase [Gloeophyllum trabeum ATCC 11539]|uniref:DNA-(apurinic or apyrimidinic site) lyase n=1 Tax=Gloeophyllum trabeum (strain ATCC 11539 / FP-39264 / Madison 617) TaxID=670483 RepID=S7QEQ4_GLOTA|nr:DNA glycosylase [Gloeophyllum trabeum ATCC 11539]EPQ58306.1 DNA glycosylase [Gloeophyllum trabeum ATCC 11539]
MSCPIPAGFHALPLPIVQLSLAAVLKCGQSFRWSVFPLSPTPLPLSYPSHEYRFCLKDRVVCLRQSPDTLYYRTILPPQKDGNDDSSSEEKAQQETLAWIRDYFQLDVDLVALYNSWADRDPVFRKFRDRFEGIRMLRQDPWENLISFICSSNNNIVRITKMITSLCDRFSPRLLSLPPPDPYPASVSPLSPPATPSRTPSPPFSSDVLTAPNGDDLRAYHPFPSPSALASSSVAATLRTLGFGYRAEYVQKTAQMLVGGHFLDSGNSATPDEWLRTLRDMPTTEARDALLRFMGVGRKVADCVLLMSLDKNEVVPVDTHVHHIAMKHYGVGSSKGKSSGKIPITPKIYDEVNAKLAQVWGDYAGWAHSVLFTADLKSFSTYGLEAPLTSASAPSAALLGLPTLPLTPSPSQEKASRKCSRRAAIQTARAQDAVARATTDDEVANEQAPYDLSCSLAERVKKRRRTAAPDIR